MSAGIVLVIAGAIWFNAQGLNDVLLENLRARALLGDQMQADRPARPLWNLDKDAAPATLEAVRQDTEFLSTVVQDDRGGVFAE